MKKVTFQDTVCVLTFDRYNNNNRTAITLYEEETGEPFMHATVNLPADLNDDEVFIKNYSENEGIAEALTEAGIIKPIKDIGGIIKAKLLCTS